jgi:hypothetical protein
MLKTTCGLAGSAADGGRLVVAGKPSGYVGVKEGSALACTEVRPCNAVRKQTVTLEEK